MLLSDGSDGQSASCVSIFFKSSRAGLLGVKICVIKSQSKIQKRLCIHRRSGAGLESQLRTACMFYPQAHATFADVTGEQWRKGGQGHSGLFQARQAKTT